METEPEHLRQSGEAVLATTVVGDGPQDVIFLHGFLGSARNLGRLMREVSQLRPDLRLIAMDLTGHGNSPPLSPGANMADVAADVWRTWSAMQREGLPKQLSGPIAPAASTEIAPNASLSPSIVAHSLGGRVALTLLRSNPTAFRDVILLDIGPGAVFTSSSRQVVDALLAAPDSASTRAHMRGELLALSLSDQTADWLLMNIATEPTGVHWKFDRQALSDFLARTYGESLWDALETAHPRMLCIRGGASLHVSDSDAARIESLGCEVVTLEGVGHDVHVEATAKVASHVARFLIAERG